MTKYLNAKFAVPCSSGAVDSDEMERRWRETFGPKRAGDGFRALAVEVSKWPDTRVDGCECAECPSAGQPDVCMACERMLPTEDASLALLAGTDVLDTEGGD